MRHRICGWSLRCRSSIRSTCWPFRSWWVNVETTFIFDTGIGVNVISPGLAASVGCVPLGETYTGRRMSGQTLRLPMSTLGSLKLGDYTRENVAISVFDLAGIAGPVSLTSFRSTPVTIDYEAGAIVIEDERSLADRMARGTPVAIDVHISLTAAPAFRQHDPRVMFQKIIHDGLIGDTFLRNFVTTYDLANSQMIFAPRG
jgi:Aspartyl protease